LPFVRPAAIVDRYHRRAPEEKRRAIAAARRVAEEPRDMSDLRHRTLSTNGIQMHVAEAGDPAAPLVLLCHGFPESWYSWRHQLPVLAAAGYHVVAPDMRGYGQTDKPDDIRAYTQLHHVGDMVGLLDALGVATATIVGHDWGAPVAWNDARIRQPALFVAGDRDGVIAMMPGAVDAMQSTMPGLRRALVLPGCGHWTQQERPREVNEALLEFLR
jgi:pimeloyl-ACP methyl ester carboxylesterase